MELTAAVIFIDLLLLISGSSATFVIKQDDAGNEFIIAFKGVDVIEHTREFPMLALGRGTFEAVDNMGNFVIQDDFTYLEPFEPQSVMRSKTRSRDLLK